jgi:hypothetical protein
LFLWLTQIWLWKYWNTFIAFLLMPIAFNCIQEIAALNFLKNLRGISACFAFDSFHLLFCFFGLLFGFYLSSRGLKPLVDGLLVRLFYFYRFPVNRETYITGLFKHSQYDRYIFKSGNGATKSRYILCRTQIDNIYTVPSRYLSQNIG